MQVIFDETTVEPGLAESGQVRQCEAMLKATKQLSFDLDTLEEAEQRVVELKKKVVDSQRAQLVGLHKALGFSSMEALIGVLEGLAREQSPVEKGQSAPKALVPRKNSKARIVDSVRKAIVAALRRGDTGMSVAEQFGVSLPTVSNIKKQAGLVKKRGASS